MPYRDFAEPGDRVLNGDMVSIPSVVGLSLGDAMAALSSAGFEPVVGNAVASSIPVGRVVGTQPAYRALRGSSVVVLTSTGVPKPTPTAKPTEPTPKPTKTRGRG